MNDLDKVLKYIKDTSQKECDEIAENAVVRCDEIKAEYAQKEQDEYWKYLGKATNETEQRLIKLGELAKNEAQKKLEATRVEMTEAAFNQAIHRLTLLSDKEYKKLLTRLDLSSEFTPNDIIARYKEYLLPHVEGILFEQ